MLLDLKWPNRRRVGPFDRATLQDVRPARSKKRPAKQHAVQQKPAEPSFEKGGNATVPFRLRASILIAATLTAYLAALFYRRDQVPAGLHNDVAEEALRGLYLVDGHHFEVITFSLGHSAETLYLYLMGAAAKLFGPSTFAIQFPSWICALLCIWLVWKLTERIDDSIPAWIPLLTAGCSVWLFHYARSGLRAICAPVFLAAFALLLDRVERRPADRIAGLVCGAVLGLSLYGYTSCRVLPIAFAVYVAFRLFREWASRASIWKRYGVVAAGALAFSIPNIVFFLKQPQEFLTRGSYVLRGDPTVNVIWSAVFPLYYPNLYRDLVAPGQFDVDGVSAGLTSSGFSPVHIIITAAILVGLWQARRWMGKPLIAFLLVTWLIAIVTLGIAGPSLTRLLILLPVYLVFAAVGFGFLARWRRQLGIPVLLLILWVGLSDGYRYLSGGGAAQEFYASEATPIGQKAAMLAKQGQKVICVVSRDANVVNFLVHEAGARVKVVEFFRRPLDPAQIPVNDFRPNSMLIENDAGFNSFATSFPAAWRVEQNEQFQTVRFPAL